MSEFKGTPGPWEAVGEDIDDFRVRAVAGKKRGPGYAVERTVCEEIRKREDALLIAAAPELLEALQRTLYQPLTGNPSYEQLVEFWEYEKIQGRGEADDMLFALATIEKALGR